MMTIEDGQTVWVSFSSERGYDGVPYASVSKGEVINAEHRIVRREGGFVGAIDNYGIERLFATEAEAWAANAEYLSETAERIAAKARECERRAAEAAAAARIVAVPA